MCDITPPSACVSLFLCERTNIYLWQTPLLVRMCLSLFLSFYMRVLQSCIFVHACACAWFRACVTQSESRHTWMSHVTSEWVMSHISTSKAKDIKRVTLCHMWMSHVAHINEKDIKWVTNEWCRTYQRERYQMSHEWVMSQISTRKISNESRMSDVAHINESLAKDTKRVTLHMSAMLHAWLSQCKQDKNQGVSVGNRENGKSWNANE
jgi:hypothetical protein